MSTLDRHARRASAAPSAGQSPPPLRKTAGDDYLVFCELFLRLTSIDLGQYKRGQMERRIRTFAERAGIKDLEKYAAIIKADPSELERFLDRVTINVSQLWRNPQQWAMLARDVLPVLAKDGKVKIWSAGSSYGAEAYTLAAVCREAIPTARVEILGTDIDKRMVERARKGHFSLDDARDAPRDGMARWFDQTADGWQAKAEIQKLVRFEVGDLLRVTPPAAAYDLILCRNTVIYFSEDFRDALHERLAGALRPGGFLMVGSTERISYPTQLKLDSCLPFTYRKAA